MKAWKKGAIIGFMWSILGFIVEIPIKEIAWLEIIFFFPILIAKLLGFVNVAAFLGGPLMGIIIGSFIGFLYDLRKEKQRTGKIELSWSNLAYWQKGAIIGLIWSIIGLIIHSVNLPDLIDAPIFIPILILNIPNILAIFWRIYIIGPLTGFMLGALVGYIYGMIKGRGK